MSVGDITDNLKERLKEYYFMAEDKWYRLVDWISDKIPAFGGMVDSIEDKGVPTFPLAIALVLLIIIIAMFMMMGTGSSLSVRVTNLDGEEMPNSTVTVFFDGTEIDSRITNIDGEAVFYLNNETYSVRIEKDGFDQKLETVIVNGNKEIGYQLSPEDVGVSKVVRLKTANGELISGSGTIKYSCEETGENYSTTYSGGAFEATFSEECETIKVENLSGYTVVEGRLSFSGAYDTVEVEELIVDTGTAIINFEGDEDYTGLKVMLKSTDQAQEIIQYNNSGTVTFEEVPTNTYYVVITDPNGNFEDFKSNDLGEIKDLAKDETITFNVSMQAASSAEINVLIKDVSDGMPLTGAEIRLISDSTVLNTKVSGATGQVTFAIPEGTVYDVEVDHPEYIIAREVGVSSATPNVEINLTKATEGNSQSLEVRVVDAAEDPIDNVKVYLKKVSDDTQIGDARATGTDGKIEFFNLETGTYYAYVVKEGFEGANSASVQVLPREQAELRVTLNIGNGEVKILTLDPERNVVSGASVKAIDYFTGEIIEQGSTNASGEKTFTIRADKSVYFELEMPDYMNYYTAAINPDEGSVTEREVVLLRETGKLSAKVMAIYSGGQELSQAERSVSEGVYTARVLMVVPQGSYSEAGVHIRTGAAEEGKTNYMEEDPSYLGSSYTSADSTKRGTTYSPEDGYTTDKDNFTSGNSKWFEARWRNPKEGAYETDVELYVTNAAPGSSINLWYRAWAKGSSVFRYPTDTPSTELYAQANNYVLSGGAASLCEDSFCKSYIIETLTGSNAGRKQFVNSSFSAKQDTSYRLTYNLTNYGGQTLGESVLTVNGSGMDVDTISVNGEEEESPVTLGSLVADSFTQGTVEFSTPSSGSASLNLVINSSSGTEMDDTISISIKSNKEMDFDFVPEEIIPYVDNSMFFEVKDDNSPLSNVVINVYSNGDSIGNTETTSEGLAVFELEAPAKGDIIKIVASKEGYNDFEYEKEVDDEILLIVPNQINNTIKIGEFVSLEEQVLIENWTVKDLVVSDIDFGGDLETYMNLSVGDGVVGSQIKTEEDLNFFVELKLNNVGKNLVEPKTVEGTMIVDVKVEDASTYTNEVPIKIRISRPGYLDSASCLKVTPGDVEFITSTNEVSETLTIENTCTAEGIEVSLADLEVKANENINFGSLSLSGTGFNTIQVSNTYTELADFVEDDLEESLTLSFNPNISNDSGAQDVSLTFRVKNIPEENEEESITTDLQVSMNMSNLSSCLEIDEPSGGVSLNVAGWNLGYNRIINSNMQSHMQSYQGFSQRGGGGSYGGMMPYGMQQSMPFMQAGNQTGSLAYEQNQFTIKNNCNVEVEIDLDPDSSINVANEKFSISADDDYDVEVTPGYTLGRYDVEVNAKISGTEDAKEKIGDVDVTVQRLGDIDDDCIKVNVSVLKFNSFLYEEKTYKAYNYCYDVGVQLSRTNNAISIQCDAPATSQPLQQSQSYFQTGHEQNYGNSYPMTQQFNSYYDYLNPTGDCTGNSCHMVSSVRVRDRTTNSGASGTIETIIFEVRPSTSYIPQRKLFDEQTNKYGLFSSIGAIRDWATQTDTRTRVYGTLGVQYTNQYGSQQNMCFNIQLEDQWRIGESIDSAINWGDPNANPADCVNKDALDLISFWEDRASQSEGAIPEGTHWVGGTKYIHIAEPPAVRIGAPSALKSGSSRRSDDDTSTASAKCGYLDSLSNIQISGDNVIDGVKLTVEGTTSGSVLKNNRGPNLAVEVDRSGMISDCVIIETTVKARLRRAVNFDSQEVFWPLRVKVLRAGVDPATISDEDCKLASSAEADIAKECQDLVRQEISKNPKATAASIYNKVTDIKKACTDHITTSMIEGILEDYDAEELGKCNNAPSDYGFDKIHEEKLGETDGTSISLSSVIDCTEYFCSHDQTQRFLYDKYMQIEELVENAKTNAITCDGGENMLSELYKEADTFNVQQCDGSAKTEELEFFEGADGTAVYKDYELEEAGEDSEKIPSMVAILNKVSDESVLVKIDAKSGDDADKFNAMFDSLNMVKDGTGRYYYMTIDNYKNLIQNALDSPDGKCDDSGSDCEITNYCGEPTSITIYNKAAQYMASEEAHVRIVDAVAVDTKDVNEIEMVYAANPVLNDIHELATFDSETNEFGNNKDILLAKTTFSEEEKTEFKERTSQFTAAGNIDLRDFISEKELSFDEASVGVGQYKTTLDFDYCKTENNTAQVELEKRSEVEGAKSAEKNILLKEGFEITKKSKAAAMVSGNTILDASGNFYERTPIKLQATLGAGETGLIYKTTLATPSELIKWKTPTGAVAAADSKDSTAIARTNPNADTSALIAVINPSNNATTLEGIYYYPLTGTLVFSAGQKPGSIRADRVGFGSENIVSTSLPQAGTSNTRTIEGPKNENDMPGIGDIVALINEKEDVCVESDGTISWNESSLLE